MIDVAMNTIEQNVSFMDIVCDVFLRVFISVFSGFALVVVSLDGRASPWCKEKVKNRVELQSFEE